MTRRHIDPKKPPLLWSDIAAAFDDINQNFIDLELTIGNSGVTPVDLTTLSTSLIPSVTETYNLGSPSKRWNDLYLSGSTIYLGGAEISATGNTVNLPVGSTIGGLRVDESYFKFFAVSGQTTIEADEGTDTITFDHGNGIDIETDATTDTITILNTGVTQNLAGTGIAVSGDGRGNVTISNSGVISLSPGLGIGITGSSGNLTIANTGIREVRTDPGSGILLEVANGVVTVTNGSPASTIQCFRTIQISGTPTPQPPLQADSNTDSITIVPTGAITITTTADPEILTIGFNNRVDIIGSVFSDNSTLLVDGPGGRIPAEVVQGTFTGNVVGNLTGTASVSTTVTLTATNSTVGTHYIAFVDSATGNENVRTDTALTYNPGTDTLTAGNFVGTITGNVFTNLIDSADSSAIVITPIARFESDISVENDLTVRNLLTTNSINVTGRLVASGSTLSKAVQSEVTSISNATGVVTHNYALGSTFRHLTPTANFTVNITNMNLSNGFITQVRLIIVQGATPRVPTAVQIDGASQTLLWKDNSIPAGNANKRDVVLFTISNIGGSYIVLGELSTYG